VLKGWTVKRGRVNREGPRPYAWVLNVRSDYFFLPFKRRPTLRYQGSIRVSPVTVSATQWLTGPATLARVEMSEWIPFNIATTTFP
jgi:hypothetical protein